MYIIQFVYNIYLKDQNIFQYIIILCILISYTIYINMYTDNNTHLNNVSNSFRILCVQNGKNKYICYMIHTRITTGMYIFNLNKRHYCSKIYINLSRYEPIYVSTFPSKKNVYKLISSMSR